ncbi:methylenetetrahydrofolate reductase [NAD(P)H] [Clostridium folliculivorans]|uniref:methylenetetrahydrofolate reductase [NAD(P)H] n=1 Tax=Clostridium folliculivorans TaxID=2886038 RepID=UPI0021C3E2A1|nr:methylenetetrahydrofolate reductase [NAD(P)H] [Clostridium folliculivorans]GKU28610.1 methylenetetrahydrofolate reductase [Clostridium folliculivorans]
MLIKDLFKQKRMVFSFEIFPPKLTSPIETVYKTIEELAVLNPDYISVTYGAGGSVNNNRTCELSSLVKNKYGIEALAHLTCINSSEDKINKIVENLNKNNIKNILALRGDVNGEENGSDRYTYAFELIKHLRDKGNLCLGAACYPEGHVQSDNLDNDILHLKNKVDAGADFLVSQLFFDNNLYYNFLDKAASRNINIPIQAGIMPVTNKKQIERIASLSGAYLPQKFIKIMDKYEHNKEALRDAGIAYAVEQIVDLVSSGVSGIHLYTMNNPYVAKKITNSIESLINHINEEAI